MVNELQNIVDDNKLNKIELNSGEFVDVDVLTANALLTILNALEDDNKEKMIELLGSNSENFLKVVKFALDNIK